MLATLLCVFGSLTAHGRITVKPVNISADPGSEVQNAVVHVAAVNSPTVTTFTGGFLDPLLSTIDLGKILTDEDNGSRASMMVFDVSSDAPPTPGLGQQLALVIEASGTTATAVPLAAAGFADSNPTPAALPSCNGGGAACYSQSATNTSYFFAMPFTAGRVMRVGFYPKDICVEGVANTVAGCSGGIVTGTYPNTINLKFIVRVTTPTSHLAAGAEDASSSIAVIFHKLAPTSCDCTDIDKLYTPADGAIYLYADKVSGGIDTTEGAPLHSVFFVANQGTVNTANGTTRSNNTVVGTPAWGTTGSLISGFENATAASGYTSPSYKSALSVRDAAGLILNFTSCPHCVPTVDITTRDIKGFLEGRNCFISSTAFGIDSRWTEAFREFRGRVLLKTRAGRWFTSKYYSWSPAGAAWLEGHDWARVATAVLLFPLALLVWLWVHVGTLGILGLALVGGVGWRLRRFAR